MLATNVELAQRRDRPVDQRPARRAVGGVELEGGCLAAGLDDLIGGRLRALQVAVAERQICPLGGHAQRRHPPNAGGRAGHQDRFSLEAPIRHFFPAFLLVQFGNSILYRMRMV